MSAERQRPRAAYVPTQTKERAVIRSERENERRLPQSLVGRVGGQRADGGGPLDGHACPLAETSCSGL